MISRDENGTFVLMFGSGTIGIASLENTILFKEVEAGPVGNLIEHPHNSEDIKLIFNSVSSIECLQNRLEEVKKFIEGNNV